MMNRITLCARGVAVRVRGFLVDDKGMSTAEYALGTIAAAAFAAILYKVVTGGSIPAALTALIERALTAGF